MLNVHERTVESDRIDEIFATGTTHLDAATADFAVNDYCILRAVSGSQSTVARHIGEGNLICLKDPKLSLTGVKAKDSKQVAFLDSLVTPEILMSTAVGRAGTGKTTMAIAYAAHMYMNHKKPIYLSKPTTMVGRGKAFGPVPGDIKEKYAPYLDSYMIVLEKLLSKGQGTRAYLDSMAQRGDIKFIPVELARGCTYENCTFILDEAQNLGWHELNTIISRMGEGTKLIILGDLKQIDISLDEDHTGFSMMLNTQAFRDSKITSAVELEAQYRSPITQLIADVDEELNARGKRGRTQGHS